MPLDVLLDMDQQSKRMGDLRPTIEDAVALAPGDRFEFDDFALEVLHLPGHTSGAHLSPGAGARDPLRG